MQSPEGRQFARPANFSAECLQVELITAIEQLLNQKHQAAQDIEEILQRKEAALKDPIAFISQLKFGVLPKLPPAINIIALPESLDPPPVPRSPAAPTPSTSRPRDSPTSEPPQKAAAHTGQHTNLRGRSEERSITFNKLWSAQEQQRLEELLVEFPDEPVASQRFQKIARALGNRTPKQVASRVQKFFVKLAIASKPFPGGGKPPPASVIADHVRRQTERRERRENKQQEREFSLAIGQSRRGLSAMAPIVPYYRPPSVFMTDDSSDETQLNDIDDELKNTDEYRELIRLTKLQKRQQTSDNNNNNNKSHSTPAPANPHEEIVRVVHEGFACDACGSDPIVGTRYRCTDCSNEESTDLCESCIQWENGRHLRSHHLEKTKHPQRTQGPTQFYRDDDYGWSGGEEDVANYLDPNYLVN